MQYLVSNRNGMKRIIVNILLIQRVKLMFCTARKVLSSDVSSATRVVACLGPEQPFSAASYRIWPIIFAQSTQMFI